MKKIHLVLISMLVVFSVNASDNQNITELEKKIDQLTRSLRNAEFAIEQAIKKSDDLMWYNRVGDIAYIDKVRLTGPARWKPYPATGGFTDQFADNMLKFFAYVFLPRDIDVTQKYPLIVFAHSGIHSNFSTSDAHTVRELIAQGYVVIAADYRGSTGYGGSYYRNIDYGGLENEDVLETRNYMVENYSFIDPDRVGIIGWSHGGMISLMNIMKYPDSYACAYAGVPVSDLLLRLSYKGDSYLTNFTVDYHIGQTIEENRQEYERRSPVNYADRLRKPLMVTTTTNDDDVSVKEIESLVKAIKKAGTEEYFTYRIYDKASGGHAFDRIDSKEATDIRYKAHKFLEQYLAPPKPFNNETEMRQAAYFFN